MELKILRNDKGAAANIGDKTKNEKLKFYFF